MMSIMRGTLVYLTGPPHGRCDMLHKILTPLGLRAAVIEGVLHKRS